MWKIREGIADGMQFVVKRLDVLPSEPERNLRPYLVSLGWAYDAEG